MSAAEDMAPAELVGEVRELREEMRLLRSAIAELLRTRTPRLIPAPSSETELEPGVRSDVIRKMQRAEAKRRKKRR